MAKLQRAFAQSVMSAQYRLVIDLGDLLRADPETRWASWQRARQASVPSPNDALEEGGRVGRSDRRLHRAAGRGRQTGERGDRRPRTLSPLADDADKIALLGHHRGRHA